MKRRPRTSSSTSATTTAATRATPPILRTLVAHSAKEGNRLYVIIGRGVYSATGNLITDLERLADPVFVGEPSSGFGNQDGDESQVTLPYSGIHGWLTSVWWQYSHPWDKRTSIVPDVPVQLTAKAYFAGQDPVMETILKMIAMTCPVAPAPVAPALLPVPRAAKCRCGATLVPSGYRTLMSVKGMVPLPTMGDLPPAALHFSIALRRISSFFTAMTSWPLWEAKRR